MKVVFLDLDGVMNIYQKGYTCVNGYPDQRITPEAVHYLNEITRITGAKIVVSSSWRRCYTIKKLRDMLNVQSGIQGEIIDVTPMDLWQRVQKLNVYRGDEIQYWLDQHPEVESFVILDDDDDMCHLLPKLVRTPGFRSGSGLSRKNAATAIKILCPESKRQHVKIASVVV